MSQPVQKIRRPLDLLDFHQTVFQFFGTFEIANASTFVKFLMKFHVIAYQLLFTDLGFVLFTLSLLFSSSVKETLQILFVVFAYLNAAFKASTFYMKRKQLAALWSQLDDPDYEAKDHIEDGLLQVSNFHIKRIINPYSIFGAVNLMYVYLTPVLERKRHLPYPMYVPFGIDQSWVGFCFTYLYQLGNVIYAGGINIAVNMYLFDAFVSINFFLSLLSSRVSRLGYPSGYNEYYTTTIPHKKQSFYKEVCYLIEVHLKISRFVREMNALANDLIFLQVMQAAFVFANSLILLIAYELTVAEFNVAAFWLSAFLAEMSIYCYFGNNIIYTFDSIQHNIYCSNFNAFDQKTSMAMLKMMMATGRQMKIVAVGVVRVELSLQTLLVILKTTYSIVMLIKSM